MTISILYGNMKLTSCEVNFMKGRVIMKNKIKEFRTRAQMTQIELAELVHVSSRTIISIEREQFSPSLMLAYRIAQVFEVSVEELCCLKENMERENAEYDVLFKKVPVDRANDLRLR